MNKTERKLLNEDLKDESMAPKQYKKLLHHLHREEDKKIVRGIIKQEKQHHAKLLKIKRRE